MWEHKKAALDRIRILVYLSQYCQLCLEAALQDYKGDSFLAFPGGLPSEYYLGLICLASKNQMKWVVSGQDRGLCYGVLLDRERGHYLAGITVI